MDESLMDDSWIDLPEVASAPPHHGCRSSSQVHSAKASVSELSPRSNTSPERRDEPSQRLAWLTPLARLGLFRSPSTRRSWPAPPHTPCARGGSVPEPLRGHAQSLRAGGPSVAPPHDAVSLPFPGDHRTRAATEPRSPVPNSAWHAPDQSACSTSPQARDRVGSL